MDWLNVQIGEWIDLRSKRNICKYNLFHGCVKSRFRLFQFVHYLAVQVSHSHWSKSSWLTFVLWINLATSTFLLPLQDLHWLTFVLWIILATSTFVLPLQDLPLLTLVLWIILATSTFVLPLQDLPWMETISSPDCKVPSRADGVLSKTWNKS